MIFRICHRRRASYGSPSRSRRSSKGVLWRPFEVEVGHEERPMAARRGRRGPCKASYGSGSRSRWTRAGEESPSPVVGWSVSPVRVCVGRGAGWCGCGGMGEWGGGGTGSGAREGTTKAWLGSPRHGSEDMCATLNNYKKNPRGATPFFFKWAFSSCWAPLLPSRNRS